MSVTRLDAALASFLPVIGPVVGIWLSSHAADDGGIGLGQDSLKSDPFPGSRAAHFGLVLSSGSDGLRDH